MYEWCWDYGNSYMFHSYTFHCYINATYTYLYILINIHTLSYWCFFIWPSEPFHALPRMPRCSVFITYFIKARMVNLSLLAIVFNCIMRLTLTSQQKKVSVTTSSKMRNESNGLIFLCAGHGKGYFHIQTRQVSHIHGKQSGHDKSNNYHTPPWTRHGIAREIRNSTLASKCLNTKAIQREWKPEVKHNKADDTLMSYEKEQLSK